MSTASPSPVLAVLAWLCGLGFPLTALAEPLQGPSPAPEPPAESPPAAENPAPSPPEPGPPLAPTPLGGPMIRVGIEEPPPPPDRTVHQHDGFYARFAVGLSSARTFVSTDRTTHPDYSVGGAGLGLDLMLGGTPAVGFATGGALSLRGFGRAHGDGGRLALVGVFADGFPHASRGLHLGGLLGIAAASTERKDNVDELDGLGLGMSAWIGHGFWVADDFTLGGLLRFTGALTSDGSGDKGPDPVALGGSTYDIALAFSVLYH